MRPESIVLDPRKDPADFRPMMSGLGIDLTEEYL